MYPGFVSAASGAAAVFGSALALLGQGLLAVYLDRVQIPAEEKALRERFGFSMPNSALAYRTAPAARRAGASGTA